MTARLLPFVGNMLKLLIQINRNIHSRKNHQIKIVFQGITISQFECDFSKGFAEFLIGDIVTCMQLMLFIALISLTMWHTTNYHWLPNCNHMYASSSLLVHLNGICTRFQKSNTVLFYRGRLYSMMMFCAVTSSRTIVLI